MYLLLVRSTSSVSSFARLHSSRSNSSSSSGKWVTILRARAQDISANAKGCGATGTTPEAAVARWLLSEALMEIDGKRRRVAATTFSSNHRCSLARFASLGYRCESSRCFGSKLAKYYRDIAAWNIVCWGLKRQQHNKGMSHKYW